LCVTPLPWGIKSVLLVFLGGIHSLVSKTAKRVEKSVVIKVGITISVGAALCIATRTPIIDVGISCMDVALSTKNIDEAYSGCGDVSKSRAALMPYGVAAPEMPKRLTDKFIDTASNVSASSVLNTLFTNGFKRRETPRETPLSSHTFINPNQTE